MWTIGRGITVATLVIALLVVGTSVGAQTDKVFVLKFASDSPPPPANPYTTSTDLWMNEVEQRSGGRIKFQRFWSQGLVPSAEQLNAVSSGLADVTNILTSFWPAKVPLSTVGWLPGVVQDTWAGEMALRELIRTRDPLRKELEERNNIKYLTGSGVCCYGILSRKPLASIDDLKGMKIVTPGGPQADWIKALGGVPAFIPSPDRYDGLQRGVFDAITGPLTSVTVFKFYEVAKYFFDLHLGGGVHYVVMNLDVWKKLPQDLQKVFDETQAYGIEASARLYQYEGEVKSKNEKMLPAGVKFADASAKDLATGKAVAREAVWRKWIQEMEAKGLPGKETFDEYVRLYKKYEAESPFKGKFPPARLD